MITVSIWQHCQVAERGWFFESWSPDAPEQGLEACLQRPGGTR